MTRSNLDGRTLGEKRNGAGYRPDLLHFDVISWDHCAIEGCEQRATSHMEVYVDDSPPVLDAITRLLARIFERYGRGWVDTPFCLDHGYEMLRYGLDYIEDPDLWAPGRENPPVFPHPLKLLEPPEPAGLLVVGG